MSDEWYTPREQYETVFAWAMERYPLLSGVPRIVRPFHPGGDYTREDYHGAAVIDNPPFSIFNQIARWYQALGIPFLLWHDGRNLMSAHVVPNVTTVFIDMKLPFDNSPDKINIGFVTNLTPDIVAETAPELCAALGGAVRGMCHTPKMSPEGIVCGRELQWLAAHGVSHKVMRNDETHFLNSWYDEWGRRVEPYGCAMYIGYDEWRKVKQAIERTCDVARV